MRKGSLQRRVALRKRALRRCVSLSIAVLAATGLLSCTRSKQEVAAGHRAVVSRYCADCHSLAEQEGGLVLEHSDLANPVAQRATWEKVIHQLEAGLMPPPGEPRPSDHAVASLVSYLETSLDAQAVRPCGG